MQNGLLVNAENDNQSKLKSFVFGTVKSKDVTPDMSAEYRLRFCGLKAFEE